MLVVVVVLSAVALGAEAIYRVITAPWSIGLGGRDTLTGSWAGSLRARQGAEYGLYLDLEYRSNVQGPGGRGGGVSDDVPDNLQGRATLCTPTGERYEYAVKGYADLIGSLETLWLEYGDPRLSALNFRLSGTWQPGALTLRTDTNPFLPDGRFVNDRWVSSDDPNDSFEPFTLTARDRGAFEATCRRIQA